MSLRLRSLFAFVLLVVVFSAFLYDKVRSSLDERYREAVEENMVDQVRMLAALLDAGLPLSTLNQALHGLSDTRFEARIYDLMKTRTRSFVYVTDARGKVLFHSADPGEVGKDYSSWRDVALTLRGAYGARSTRIHPEDDQSSVLYVAAPLRRNGQIDGVVTLGKPVGDFLFFIAHAESELRGWLIGALVVVACGAVLASLWWIGPIRKMGKAALAMSSRNGAETMSENAVKDPGELRDLGTALRSMNESLQARRYVEEYVQVLTHELKSPISGILGAAEILESDPTEDDRRRFLSNVKAEASRMQDLVQRILQVAALERRNGLERLEVVRMETLLAGLQDSLGLQARTLDVELSWHLHTGDADIVCDQMLLIQAFHNLVLNALEHSPPGTEVMVFCGVENGRVVFRVQDSGDGVPEWALQKIGERFYSLPKPRSGRKGTGLGLSLVREVMRLHAGTFQLHNRPQGGVEALLDIPLGGSGRSG